MGYTLVGYNNPVNNINTNAYQGAGSSDPGYAPLGSGGTAYNPLDSATWTAGAPLAPRMPNGSASPLLSSEANWGGGQSGIDPWESNGQQAAQEQTNYYYGGTQNGAQNFVNQIGGTQQSLASDYNQGANTASALQGAANARSPGQFLYNPSIDANGQDRASQLGAYNSLAQFAAAPQGPSAAQAQLNMATDANMNNSLALARSGRGMGGNAGALHQALATNAVTGQQAANQSAALRAQEYQQYQQNQLNAYGQMGDIASQARTGDTQLGAYVSGTQQAAQNANDAAGEAYGNQYLEALNGKTSSATDLYGMQNNVNQAQLTANQNYNTLRQNYFLHQHVSNGTDYTPYLKAGATVAAAAAMAG